jgi:predicted RNA-binding protein Jag
MTEQAGETPLSVEAEGETVGEAKWSALRELERRFPGLDKSSVRFAVVSEGERGLLGVGYAPAKVGGDVAARRRGAGVACSPPP